MTDTTTTVERIEAPPPPPRRAGALIGLLGLLALMAFALVYVANKSATKTMLEQREAAFQVRQTPAPVMPAAPPPRSPPKAAPAADDARNRELAERLMMMQQQAEIARLQKEQDARMAAEREEREKRAKRLGADILVYSQGTSQSAQPEAAAGADPTDLFASANAALARAQGLGQGEQTRGAGGAGQAEWIPEPGDTTRGGASSSYAGPPTTTIYQGKVISAVLESRIESEKPGLVRAMVDEDIMSEDGSQVLVHRGSRLIGEYRAQVVRGDRRVLVIWQRLIRPDSVSIQLASPGIDELGVSGLTGDVDSRFFERFGAAILLSFVDGVAQRSDDSQAIYVGDAQSSANTALQDSVNLPPRIVVNQGERIAVFVARDLDFRRTDA